MSNIIVTFIIILIIGGVIFYIIREKKRGTKCIGCPSGKSCDCSSPPKKNSSR